MTDYAVPPRELMEQWASEKCYDERDWLYEFHIANRAAQWGADQELEACLRLVEIDGGEDAYDFARYIRAARRPKPPSLKEQALEGLTRLESTGEFFSNQMKDLDTIRRALEALPE
jgi:hypothetical protein